MKKTMSKAKNISAGVVSKKVMKIGGKLKAKKK